MTSVVYNTLATINNDHQRVQQSWGALGWNSLSFYWLFVFNSISGNSDMLTILATLSCCMCVCAIREAFGRTRLEQAAARCGDPGALLPAVRGNPAGCVRCAGPPLCLQQSTQAGPRGASGWPDAHVTWQMSQRSDLWHEHLGLWIG